MIPSAWDTAMGTLSEDWYMPRVLQNAPRLNLTLSCCYMWLWFQRDGLIVNLFCRKGPWVPLKWPLLGWKISSSESNDMVIVPVLGIRWGRLFIPSAWHSLPVLALPMDTLGQSGALKTYDYHYCSCYIITV